MGDAYRTLAGPADAEVRVEGSRFLAFAEPVRSRQDAVDLVDRLRKAYHDATHHCLAYRLGVLGEEFRSHDDGEPSGSAGRPILGAIERAGLTNVALVVVRYFGGVKLGVGGLARAYGRAAEAALGQGRIVTRYALALLSATFPHAQISNVMRGVAQGGARILDTAYDEEVHLTLQVRRAHAEQLRRMLTDLTRGNIDIRPVMPSEDR